MIPTSSSPSPRFSSFFARQLGPEPTDLQPAISGTTTTARAREPSMSRRFADQHKCGHNNFVGWLLLLFVSCALLPTATNAWTVASSTTSSSRHHAAGKNHVVALQAWSSTFSSPWYNEYNPTARAFVDYYDPAPATSYSFVTLADDWPMTGTTISPQDVARRPRTNPVRRALRRWALLKRIRRKV